MSKQNWGLGKLDQPVRFIRKYYWTFQADFTEAEIHLNLPKVRANPRPPSSFHEKDENSLTITFWDDGLSDPHNDLAKLYDLLSFEHGVHQKPMEHNRYGTGILTLVIPDHSKFTEETTLTNCPMMPGERWTLSDLEITNMNFGDLDFSSTETTFELTWKYSGSVYENLFGTYLNTANDELSRTRPEDQREEEGQGDHGSDPGASV
jgi:hypothetical protein